MRLRAIEDSDITAEMYAALYEGYNSLSGAFPTAYAVGYWYAATL